MAVYDVFRVAAAVLLSLGGAGAIVIGCATWLAKVWANRLLEKDRRRYNRELETIRSELERSSRVLQSELDRTTHIHRLQFEKEFEALKSIWGKLVKVRATMSALRPSSDAPLLNETFEERFNRRFDEFQKAFHMLVSSMEEQSPFYTQAIFQEFQACAELANKERISAGLHTPKTDPRWHEKGEANLEAFVERYNSASTLIRQRLERVRVLA